LSQEFKDSLHLFKQTLIRDLLDWLYPEATLLQYVDDLLQCRATEPLIFRVTESFLKLSGLWGYKVSKEKAQLCLPQVTYLSVFLKGQTPQSSSFLSPFKIMYGHWFLLENLPPTDCAPSG
jgi:hypothetical protein